MPMAPDRFRDRRDAGQWLAAALASWAAPDLLVLGLPRGGVPVAWEVAAALRAPLDVLLVRKLGVPGQEELAMGAIASDGVRELNTSIVRQLGVTPDAIRAATEREQRELDRRLLLYRGHRPPVGITGQSVVLVDDGLATGATMRAAVTAVSAWAPRGLIVAVPVAPAPVIRSLTEAAQRVVCLITPEPFDAVGCWYDDFAPTTDDEVRALLANQPSR